MRFHPLRDCDQIEPITFERDMGSIVRQHSLVYGSNPCGTNTNANRYTNKDIDADADTHPNGDTNSDGDINRHTDTSSDAYANAVSDHTDRRMCRAAR